MGAHTTRLPENLENYIEIIISRGYATSYGNALNLIVAERMMRDKELGDVSPFEYRLIDSRRKPEPPVFSEILTENVKEEVTQVPPATRGPDPHADAGYILPQGAPKIKEAREETVGENSPAILEFGPMNAPVFPGTIAEYEEALRKGTIKASMFRRPEA